MRALILAGMLGCAAKQADVAASPAADQPAPPPAPVIPEVPGDVAAPPDDAEVTSSGIASRVLTPGAGTEHPGESSLVTVHYSGWTADGEMFDSSIPRGRPATFPLDRVIPGWTEGLQLMVTGEKRRLWIPADLGYGEAPTGGQPAGQLTFDIELIDFVSPPTEWAPPADAQRTASGIAWIVGTEGTGEPPRPEDTVSMHYTVWSEGPGMVENSRQRGEPVQFPVEDAVPGWIEAVQLMKPGEKARFWIPADLLPPGSADSVFDFELVQVHRALPPPPSVAGRPADAIVTDSGLAYVIVTPGDPARSGTPDAMAVLHFTAWSPDGKMQETTRFRKTPAQIPLPRIHAPGLEEGLLGMKAGETRRLWIPAALGLEDAAPREALQGDLVYEIELIDWILPTPPPTAE